MYELLFNYLEMLYLFVNSFIQSYFYLFYAQYFILFNLTFKSMNVRTIFLFTSRKTFSFLLDT